MREYFRARQKELFSAYSLSTRLGHSVPTGNERELVASEFLSKHLPSIAEVTSGMIIDQKTTDFQSLRQTTDPQIDLLVHLRHSPGLSFYGGTRVFFSESVAAVIEVKPELNSVEHKKIIKHCSKVKERKREILGLYMRSPENKTTGPADRVPYYVFAFESKKNAKEIISIIDDHSKNMTAEDKMSLLPDGYFILDPEKGAVVLKGIGLHPTVQNMPGATVSETFQGYDAKLDSLLMAWLVLVSQVDLIKLLSFPYKSYANKIFGV